MSRNCFGRPLGLIISADVAPIGVCDLMDLSPSYSPGVPTAPREAVSMTPNELQVELRPRFQERIVRALTLGLPYTIKRSIDIIGALFGLLLLAPVMLSIALLIRFDSPGPVLF